MSAIHVQDQNVPASAECILTVYPAYRGRDGYEGSEHYLEGAQYPLELHFVHVNSKYSDLTAALASGQSDALLVVGQMFAVGAEQSATMTTIANGIIASDIEADRSLVLSHLLDISQGYYTYSGSLTTPPCNPVVTWVVLASVIDITQVAV
jgi:carbonic anhydrase